MKAKVVVPLAVFIFALDFPIFSNSTADDSPAHTSVASTPFLLSLIFSHGSGLYNIDQPRKARPYLLSNIFLVDIPLIGLAGSMIMNYLTPELFEGNRLTAVEYVVNTLLVTVLVSAPIIRFFECRDVIRETVK